MTTLRTARMLTRYKAWADDLIFEAAARLPEGEATKVRPTLFKSIVHTLNHTTYHRGFIADMFYQVPARPPTTDLPVYLRESAA